MRRDFVSVGARSWILAGSASGRPVGRELFSHNLAHGVESRSPVDMLKECVVDQSLIVTAASLVDHVPEILDHRVVQANRDLRLPWRGSDDRATLRAREIYFPTFFSYDLFHKDPFDACSLGVLAGQGEGSSRAVTAVFRESHSNHNAKECIDVCPPAQEAMLDPVLFEKLYPAANPAAWSGRICSPARAQEAAHDLR